MHRNLLRLPSATLLLTLCFCSPDPVAAQASLLGPGAAFISGGVSQLATQELDDRLASEGYPTFGSTTTTIGIGAYRTLRSGLMLGAEFNGLIMGEEDVGGREIGFGGGYATLGAGYQLNISRRIRAYPRIGIGGGGFGLWFDNDPDSVAFNDVLTDPQPVPATREIVMNRNGGVIDLGAGIEFLRTRRGSGALVGLRFGYLVAPFNSSWNQYSRTVTGGPDASISGLYIRGVLGGAWRR
jgi:hypothetical protein